MSSLDNYMGWIIQNSLVLWIRGARNVLHYGTMKLFSRQIKDIITTRVYDYQQ